MGTLQFLEMLRLVPRRRPRDSTEPESQPPAQEHVQLPLRESEPQPAQEHVQPPVREPELAPQPELEDTISTQDATKADKPSSSSKNWIKRIMASIFKIKSAPLEEPIVISTETIEEEQCPEATDDIAKLLKAVEHNFGSYFQKAEIEPANKELRRERDFNTQREAYQWQEPGTTSPSYPPCLSIIPTEEQVGLLEIFNAMRLVDASGALLQDMPKIISEYLYGKPIGTTMAGLEARLARLRRTKKNIGTEPSIANRLDWYTDSVFAQQSFTGSDPTSISRASIEWISRFKSSAKFQRKRGSYELLCNAEADSIHIQDYSYFRNAIGASPDSILTSDDGKRFGCAAVTLFKLTPEGSLHPLAIVLDYRVSMENSVVVFNERLSPTDSTKSEASDWPWRYAKMCHQVSDWTRHELAVHLNDCHFVAEATIVAAQRSFDAKHVVYRLLEPHWLKILSLNAAARSTLVPSIIGTINGFTNDQTYKFILDAYKGIDWTARYIPNDLKSRGFALSSLKERQFHNYAWARNMVPMWNTLYNFVSSVLRTTYLHDSDVAKDKSVALWCAEMQSLTGGQMASFPDIQTLDDLTNAVVMCIHISSPQHNSINYLQSYYMSFVPNKPASLMAPLPATINHLMAYKEQDIINALPVNNPEVWLLSSQLPYLLSYGVAEAQTLVTYARGLEEDARRGNAKSGERLHAATKAFYDDLLALGIKFDTNSDEMDDRIVAYNVMDPMELAVSILI